MLSLQNFFLRKSILTKIYHEYVSLAGALFFNIHVNISAEPWIGISISRSHF